MPPSSGVAARAAGWQRRAANVPGPYAAGGEQPVGGPVMVELLIDGLWTDITGFVLTRDGSGNIAITVGQTGEGAAVQAGSCRFEVNNRDGRFSPRNPRSPYYGKIGRNTPVRVSVPNGNVKDYRFWGEISAWPTSWDVSGRDVAVDVEAAGILRRLSQGAAALRSTLYRGLTAPGVANAPVAYWPCEDMAGATSLASGLPGGPAMTITGSPSLASFDGFVASAPLPVMADGSFTGAVPTYALTGAVQIRFLLAVPADGAADGQTVCKFTTNGLVKVWELFYGTGGSLTLTGRSGDGTEVGSLGPFAFGLDGLLMRVSVELTETTGSDLDVSVTALEVGSDSAVSALDTWGSLTFGRITSVAMAPDRGLTDTALGQVSVQSAITNLFDLRAELEAYAGESAADRLVRLTDAANIPFELLGTGTDTVLMGPQGQQTLLALLGECAEADLGVLFERWTAFGLGYRTRTDLENQVPALALSYTAHELAAVPTPTEDDQNTRNDWTVTRTGGSSARATLDVGALSVREPPNGVGRYDDSVTVNVATDGQLASQASWRLHLGTVDEARYPQVTVNLARTPFTEAGSTLRAQALGVRPGDRITVSDPPAWLPPDDIDVLVLGRSETLDGFQHTLVFVCAPFSPYRVAVTGDGVLGRVDTDGCAVTVDVPVGATEVEVVSLGEARWVDSATYPDDFPFDIRVGGEVMTVTACTGTSAVQVFTATRGVNGVTVAHNVGTDVRLAQPAIAAL